MEDLLELVTGEQADGLSLHVGTPPVIVVRGECHTVEGPVITPENADQLVKSLADTRQARDIRERGKAEFVYTFRDSSRFLVRAKMEDENVGLDLQRQMV